MALTHSLEALEDEIKVFFGSFSTPNLEDRNSPSGGACSLFFVVKR